MHRRPSFIPCRHGLLLACALAATLVAAHGTTGFASALRGFSSDGCSLFPDGTITDRNAWCSCCLDHDIAYWQGGTARDREKADTALKDCVLQRTGNAALAETMYLGVRAGGHPAFPTWYRWGYGWDYGRGYAPLNAAERELVRKALEAYRAAHPDGYCAEHHGKKAKGVVRP